MFDNAIIRTNVRICKGYLSLNEIIIEFCQDMLEKTHKIAHY